MRRILKNVLASIATGCLLFAAPTVASAEESPLASGDLTFTFIVDTGYAGAYESMMNQNASGVVADFFGVQVDRAVAGHDVSIPGLELYDEGQREDILRGSAEAAATGAATLPTGLLPPEVGSAEGNDFSISSFASAAVLGGPINLNFSWQYALGRIDRNECDLTGCETTGSITYRFTTNPGSETTATSLNFTRIGVVFNPSVTLSSRVYLNNRSADVQRAQTWNTSGSGIQYNYHNPALGRTFQAYYYLTATTTQGDTAAAEYKTGITARCVEPQPRAFQCRWP